MWSLSVGHSFACWTSCQVCASLQQPCCQTLQLVSVHAVPTYDIVPGALWRFLELGWQSCIAAESCSGIPPALSFVGMHTNITQLCGDAHLLWRGYLLA